MYRKLCEFLAAAFLIAGVGIVSTAWGNLPERIPVHFNLAGQPDRWEGKQQLLLLLGVQVFVYVVLTIVRRFPRLWNMPFQLTPENREAQLALAAGLLDGMKAAVCGVFAVILWGTVETALGRAPGLPPWFIPATLVPTIGGTAAYFFLAWQRR
jgi:hypothetical protein